MDSAYGGCRSRGRTALRRLLQRGFEVNFTGIDSSDEERNAYAGALAKALYESLQPVKGGGGRPGLRSRPAR